MSEHKKIQETWKDDDGRVIEIVFSQKGKKPTYLGIAVITQRVTMNDGKERVQDLRTEFNIDAPSLKRAFSLFDDGAQAVADKMKEEAEARKRKLNARIVEVTPSDLDRLSDRNKPAGIVIAK